MLGAREKECWRRDSLCSNSVLKLEVKLSKTTSPAPRQIQVSGGASDAREETWIADHSPRRTIYWTRDFGVEPHSHHLLPTQIL
jgi:hypothetical protein